VVFFVKDVEARYVLANLTLARRCGHATVAPILGKTCSELFPENLGPLYTQQDQRLLAEGEPLIDQLEMHLFSGRESGWCLTHKLPVHDQAGAIVGLAGISHDLPAGAADYPAYDKVALVDAYIVSNCDRNITLAELTELSGLSTAQLERYCKRIYQLTPRQLIHKARIERASQLLVEGQLSITDIGLGCGYSDHSAFTRQFKAVTGLTPQQFRQRHDV
jgi:AraC-like DNA-binding protein